MSKKLLFIVNVDWFFISHRLPIAIAAQKMGFEVHIATHFTKHKNELLEKGFILHSLDIKRNSQTPIDIVKNLINFRRKILIIKPHIIHLITIKPILLGSIAVKLIKENYNIVISITGLGYIFTAQGLLSRLRTFCIKMVYRYALSNPRIKVIFQNDSDRNEVCKFANLKQNKTVLIPGSGVDIKKFAPQKKKINPPVILFASRLLKSKGIYEFIEASNLVNNKVIFAIAGKVDKNHNDAITKKELELILRTNNIEYWGYSNKMEELLNRCTLLVLPSYREGLPKVIIEAAACGKPVITTNVPGCKDSIINKKTGILVPLKDSKAIAKAIDKLILNKELCEEFGNNARLLALSKFNLKHVVKEHKKIYSSFLKNSKS